MNNEQLRAEWRPLAEAFAETGKPLYAVGGFVRDGLMGRPNADLDLTSALRPDETEALLRAKGIRCRSVDPRLGTLRIWLNGHWAEYTAFRTESYGTGGDHRPDAVCFTDSVAEDALRRDFTCNAVYQDLLTGDLVDPLGGIGDIEAGVLRAARTDAAQTLSDDGLRILRLVRFRARLDFTVEERTLSAAKRYAYLLRDIAWERKRAELDHILTGERVLTALELLWELDAWQWLIPELSECSGVEQRSDYHSYDVLGHLFRSCAAADPVKNVRLAALLHDIGKPCAKERDGNFHAHPIHGERMARSILERLRYPKETVTEVCFLIRNHMFDLDGSAKEATLRRRFCLWGEARVRGLIDLREADVRGSGKQPAFSETRWRALLDRMLAERVPFLGEGLAVNGDDIRRTLGAEGAAIGRIKARLVSHCAVHPEENVREILLKRMRDCR